MSVHLLSNIKRALFLVSLNLAFSPVSAAQSEKENLVRANAKKMLTWFAELGVDLRTSPLPEIYVEGTGDAVTNHTLYEPGTPPRIYIGRGDGTELQRLQEDPDMIFHEVAHHVIYRYLPSPDDESGILHEGLADFFANAFTGDPCFAELVCPHDRSSSCQRKPDGGLCLRRADNSYTLRDNPFFKPHHKGQIVSGFLWDVHTKAQVPIAVVAAMLLESLPHLGVTPTLNGFARAFVEVASKPTYPASLATLVADLAKTRELEGGRP